MSPPPYAERLGVPRPDLGLLVERYDQGELRLIDLLVGVLLERGGPVALDEAAARLAELGVRHWHDDLAMVLKRSMAPSPEVTIDREGRFALAILDPEDDRLGRRLRKLRPPPPSASQPGPSSPQDLEAVHRKWRERQAAERKEAAALRRVLIHGVTVGARLRAAGLLDPESGRIETFVEAELGEMPERLARYDLVIGIGPRHVLHGLGADPDAFRLADLDRPQKTRKVGRRGRRLQLTNEMLVSGTVGGRRPLGREDQYRGYLEKRHLAGLRRRLERDLEALWAYYRFGVLHREVCLRWGAVEDFIPAGWAHPGDPSLLQMAREARESGRVLEVVPGRPPAWPDPWEGSTLVEVEERGSYDLLLVPLPGQSARGGDLIFEARVVEPPQPGSLAAEPEVRVRLSLRERDLVLESCLTVSPELERRLRIAPLRGAGSIEIRLDPDELDQLAGDLAFAANHSDDSRLQERLDRICDRLTGAAHLAVN
ncbi:MAG: hypothetical protein ACLF0P_14750 [Thermoanaerobaculia bacterium]